MRWDNVSMRNGSYYIAREIVRATNQNKGCGKAFWFGILVFIGVCVLLITCINTQYYNEQAQEKEAAAKFNYEKKARSASLEYTRKKLYSLKGFELGAIKDVYNHDGIYTVYGCYQFINTSYPNPQHEQYVYEVTISFNSNHEAVVAGFNPRYWKIK